MVPSRMAKRPNWRRLAASALRAAGLDVAQLAPGTVLVSRSAKAEPHGLGGGAALVALRGVTSTRWFDLERRLAADLPPPQGRGAGRRPRGHCRPAGRAPPR